MIHIWLTLISNKKYLLNVEEARGFYEQKDGKKNVTCIDFGFDESPLQVKESLQAIKAAIDAEYLDEVE